MTEEIAGTLVSPSLSNSIISPPHLPFDLVAEILCRLSIKLLIQLRCVCKSWNSLISGDSEFAKKHLLLSASSHDRHHLILSSSQFVLHHSPISSIFSSGLESFLTTSLKQFSHSIREILNENAYGNGVSTCDGMIIGEGLRTSQVLAYFLGLFPRPIHGTFVNDSVNWLVIDTAGGSRFIVSLDLEKESYQKLSFPVKHVQFTTSFMTLGTLKGCLSLISLRDNFYDVWIMKEYGNEKFWNKLLSVPHMKECGVYVYARALYISKNDKC